MVECPILFSGPMVRAILDGRKTRTRRVVKPQPTRAFGSVLDWLDWGVEPEQQRYGFRSLDQTWACSYGGPHSRLWVREAWRTLRCYDDLPGSKLDHSVPIQYEADHAIRNWPKRQTSPLGRYRHARFMPHWAFRLTLEVTAVRVERLQEMTFDDWVADFCPSYTEQEKARATFHGWDNQRAMAKAFWDSLNEKRGFGWETNCWAWVISFRKFG